MDESLGEQFMRSQGAPLTVDGRQVQMMFEPAVGESGSISVSMVGRADLTQGLHIKVSGARLDFSGRLLDDVILWTDTAPAEVSIPIVRTKGAVRLRMWNVWRGPAEVTHAWIGNAGLIVTRLDSENYLLECSAGPGRPSFDDLEVRVAVGPTAHGRTSPA